MKKLISLMLTLCLILGGASLADGFLPDLTDLWGVEMPNMENALHRRADETGTLEDGGTSMTFRNVDAAGYDACSQYLSEAACSLESQTIEGAAMTAVIGREGVTFTLTYDFETGVMTATYPEGTSAEAYNPFHVGDIVTFGRYEQDNNRSNGAEAIEWLVLEVDEANGRALVISRYGLDAKPYNTRYTDVTWATCTLRTWLNSDFLNAAFTADEQAAILTTTVDNSSSQGYWSTNGGSNTQDKIFLLSYAEVHQYFGVQYWQVSGSTSNMQSRVAPTAYAIAQGASTSNSGYKTADGKAAGWWWLRSPGYDRISAAYVSSGGALRDYYVSRGDASVRPAFWINLESGIF